MASIVITINTDGPVFHGDPAAYERELARILDRIVRDVTVYGVRPGLVHDINDTPCGTVEVID